MVQGVPAGLLDDFFEFEFPVEFGGNPDLDPEKADTLTAGIVLRSPFESPRLAGLQLSLDWYRIEIDEAITYLATGDSVVNCFDPALNPGLAVDNFWCTQFHRDPAHGTIADAFDAPVNLAATQTSGVDVALDWNLPLGPGSLGVQWLIGWIDSFEVRAAPGRSAGGVRGHRRRLRRVVPRVEMAAGAALFVARTGWRCPLAIHRLDARRCARLPF